MTDRNDSAGPPRDFLAVKGPHTLQVTPQTPRGWRLMAAWIAALLVPHVPFLVWAATLDDTPEEFWVFIGLVPLLLLNALTVWAMIRWMLARATIVSPADLQDQSRDRRSRTGRGRH
jgi:hypothetical protein